MKGSLYNRSYANRGAQLERLVDMTNRQYQTKGIADIRKVPTPVQITKHNGRTVTGYTKKGEWVDYVGVYDGRSIVFDAKETRETTRFPLANITHHQFLLLESWYQKGAKSFLIISYTKRNEIYLLPFKQLQEAWEGYVGDGRKSIPYEEFLMNCDLITSDKGYVLHYLKHV
ncbi:Holliday junction resolvase RecU [Bacillus sp. J14TS2]|uniref:Holliday junction resolvase RecU n=1 Tax=Bacillus sp. J14TS2 TaxID=2807188 RepID=UPI001B0D7540|nr:Holliday junction resolvase RecU [Bacillus sp. J14TS2]GIN71165.1 Holliday junction resolvase RecU [Bacillus sp. J14TS2]